MADGGADTIHCGVAATYDDDVFAMRIHRAAVENGHGIAKALAVRNGEKIERRDDSLKPTAWRGNRPCLVDAGGNKHGVMLRAQIIQRRIAAHFEIRVENNAGILKPLHTAHDNVFLQLETGDAISQQSAHPVVTVIDMNVIASDAQIFRRRQSTRASANNANRLAARRPDLDGFYPALLPRRIGDVFFDRANRDGVMACKFNDAIALAQAILRADTAANLGHSAGQVRQLISFAQTAFGGEAQPIGNMVVQRAVH